MEKTITEQSNLIGEHPTTSFFCEWLIHEDITCLGNKKHRKLLEIDGTRSNAVEHVSDWIIKHHLHDSILNRQKRKRKEILEKYQLDEYLKNQNLLPVAEKTMRGNATEIILAEYLQASSNLKLLIFKLRYNPNVNQSMKGDDISLSP